MRLLVGLQHHTLPDRRDHGLLGCDIPEFPFDVIRRIATPHREYLVDRLDKHCIAIALEVAHHFHVGSQPAGPDTEHEPAFEHVIDHRDRRRDLRGMIVRQIDCAAAELDLLRASATLAMNARHDGIDSQMSVTCSPM